jgi:hypothetical protein
MPNKKQHMKASNYDAIYQPSELQDKVHSHMDSTVNIHGPNHRKDDVHTLEGVYKKFGTRGISTALSLIKEDATNSYANNVARGFKKLKRALK